MDIMEIANNLGKAITETKEYNRLKEVEKLFKSDKKTQDLLTNFDIKQRTLQVASISGSETSVNKYRKELTELYKEIKANELLNELDDALNDFLKLKKRVYSILESYMDIEDNIHLFNKKQHGCKNGCGGCKKI
jgi:cell fate (sporulation/competence/biofilm development) regulator YlbF (YheA/YmcA/DUF963 family)